MSELSKRVAVAAGCIPVVLGLVWLGGWYLAAPLAVFALLGSLELYRLAGTTGLRAFRGAGAASAVGFVALATWQPIYRDFAPWALGQFAALTMGVLMAALVWRGPTERPLSSVAVTIFAPVYTGLSLASVQLLHAMPMNRGWAGEVGPSWSGLILIALPLAATWVGDACAYFAGTAWGRSKLAPSISPNKSWVGFWADLGGGAVAGIVWYALARAHLTGLPFAWGGALAIGALLGLVAVVGDLAESLIKREAGVKDSGCFFPGHGGVLDRLDSLFFTLPTAYLTLHLWGVAQ